MRYLQNALTSEIWVTWINELIILTIYINVICWENIILQRLYICLVVCNFSLMPYFVHCVSFLLYFNFCSDDEPLRHNRVGLTPGLCYPESDQAHAPLGSKLTRFQGVVNRKWKHAHDEDKRYVFHNSSLWTHWLNIYSQIMNSLWKGNGHTRRQRFSAQCKETYRID